MIDDWSGSSKYDNRRVCVFHQLLLTMRRCHRFWIKNKDEMCIPVYVSKNECNAGRLWEYCLVLSTNLKIFISTGKRRGCQTRCGVETFGFSICSLFKHNKHTCNFTGKCSTGFIPQTRAVNLKVYFVNCERWFIVILKTNQPTVSSTGVWYLQAVGLDVYSNMDLYTSQQPTIQEPCE